MAESMEQFGNRIKAKYPDYKDIDPVELAQRVIAKYPEYKDSVIYDGPTDPYGRPVAREEAIREELPSETFGRYAEPISQFAGMLAKKAPMGAALAGAATMATEIAKQGIQAIGSEPGAPQSFTESGSRIAKAFGRGALGEGAARGAFGAAAAAGRAMAPRAIKTGAQMMKVSAGIPERTGEAVLSDPSRLGRAPSREVAGPAYGKAMESVGLQQGPKAAVEIMGEKGLTTTGSASFAYNAVQKLKRGELSYQEALVARDEIKKILRAPKWQNPELSQSEGFLKELRGQLDDYLEPYFKEAGESFQKVRADYREAKLAEDFSSLLPTSANKTASVLRGGTTAALAAMGGAGGLYGNEYAMPAAALAAGMMSPRLLGLGIRSAAFTAPAVREAAKFGTRLGTQSAAGSVFPSSTEELMRKYLEQK